MISVIIPTHNCAPYLRQAIESVLQQSYSDFEIIVIDDGSTDNTRDVLSGYENRIKYVFQDNQGASAARNHGLTMAGGDYVAFLDADDLWFPDKLKKQMQVFSACPDCVAVFSNFHITRTDGEIVSKDGMSQDYTIFKYEGKTLDELFDLRQGNVFIGNLFSSLFLGNFILTSSFIVRRSVLDDCGGFNTDLITQEDYDLWLRLALTGSFAYIDQPLLNRSKRPGQLTSDGNKLRVAEDSLIVVEKYSRSQHLLLDSSEIDKRLRQKYRNLCLNYLRMGARSQARGTLRRSLKKTGVTISTLSLMVWSFVPNSLDLFIRKHLMPLLRS